MNTYLRWGILAGLFAIPFISFIVLNGFFFPYITGKGFVFRIIVELIFGAWVILAIRDKRYRPKNTWIYGAVTLFVIIVGLADMLGVHIEKSFWSNFERMEGYITILHIFGLFLVASTTLNTEKLWMRYIYVLLGTSILMVFNVLPEIINYWMAENTTGLRVDGTFGNSIYLAVYALINMFIALFAFFHYTKSSEGNRKFRLDGTLGNSIHEVVIKMFIAAFSDFSTNNIMRWIFGITAFLNLAMVWYTGTRGTLLGIIAGIGLTALLIALFERKNKVIRIVSVGLIAAGLLSVAGLFMSKETDFVKGNYVLNRIVTSSLDSGTVVSRLMIWDMAYEGWKEKPLLGWGQGNFTYVFSQYYDPGMYGQEPWFDRAHNVFFDWLIQAGIVGLLSYLLMYVAAIYHIWKKDENDFTIITKSILTGLLAGYFVHNVFVFDNLISYILFFTLLAYLHFRADRSESKAFVVNAVSRIKGGLTSIRTDHMKDSVYPALILVVTVGMVYSLNYKQIKTNTTLIQALNAQPGGVEDNLSLFKKALAYDTFARSEVRERLVFQALDLARQKDMPQEIKNRYERLAVSEMEKQVLDIPGDSKYSLFLSSYLSNLGRFEEALTYAKLAREKSPQKQAILFELGNIYINTGKYDEALPIFKEAYESAPEYREALKFYLLAAIYSQEDDLANTLADTYALSYSEADRIKYVKTLADGTLVPLDQMFVNAYAKVNDFEKIVEIWITHVEQNPMNAQYHYSLAATYLQLGKKENALSVLEGVIELVPDAKEQAEFYITEIKEGRMKAQ